MKEKVSLRSYFAAPISNERKAELWARYLDMARKIASHYSKQFHKPYFQMQTEAESIYGLLVARWNDRYDCERSEPSTFVWVNVSRGLLYFLTRKNRPTPQLTTLMEDGVDEPEARTDWLGGIWASLGEDARLLTRTILRAPGELVEDVTLITRKRARAVIRERLRDWHSWTGERFLKAWTELHDAL